MSEMITDNYIIIDARTGLATLNIPGLTEISDEKFIAWRLDEMKRYIREHEYLAGKHPSCNECLETISDSKELIRYFGASLTPDCFKEIYHKERSGLKEDERRYFDRIERLFC